jgi:acylpyruvate hydrolase
VINDGGRVVIPVFSNDCHHEVELALLIGKGGKSIQESQVIEHIAGYGIAIDLTLRDVQAEQKKKGLPWEIAKGFDTACPLSGFVSPRAATDYQNLQISLKVNGELRQSGNTGLMIYSIPALVSYISGVFRLDEGDVILTGTPAGVGRIKSGDLLAAEIEQVGMLHVIVA